MAKIMVKINQIGCEAFDVVETRGEVTKRMKSDLVFEATRTESNEPVTLNRDYIVYVIATSGETDRQDSPDTKVEAHTASEKW